MVREESHVTRHSGMCVTATLRPHEHYPEGWHHYQLSTPVLCSWLRTDDPVDGIVIAHVADPLDGAQVTLVTHAGHNGQPHPAQEWRTLDGDQVQPHELVRWILTRHARAVEQLVKPPSPQIEA